MIGLSLSSQMVALFLLSGIIPFALIIRSAQELLILQEQRLPPKIVVVFMIVLIPIVPLAMDIFLFPQIFLFFNALPLAASMTFYGLSAFLLSFESIIYHPRLDLGRDYSLLKLIVSPRSSVERLQVLLRDTEPGRLFDDFNDRRVIRFQQQARAREEQRLANRQESLRLPLESKEPHILDLKKLRARQQQALSALPESAIIDDMGIYLNELAKETIHYERYKREEQDKNEQDKNNQCPPNQIEARVKQRQHLSALARAKEAITRLETAYCATLSPVQQTLYAEYRETTCRLSAPHGECDITDEPVMCKGEDAYIMLEKISWSPPDLGNPGKHISGPGGTHLWLYKPVFLSQMSNDEPIDPFTRDPLYAPTSVGNIHYEYKFYNYATVQGHALSLQLCEAIEKFCASLKLSPANSNIIKPEPTDLLSSQLKLDPKYPSTNPHTHNQGVSAMGMFSGSADVYDSDVDIQAIIAELNDEERSLNGI